MRAGARRSGLSNLFDRAAQLGGSLILSGGQDGRGTTPVGRASRLGKAPPYPVLGYEWWPSEEMRRDPVFLLDDHEVVRRGIADLLDQERDLEVVGEASTASARHWPECRQCGRTSPSWTSGFRRRQGHRAPRPALPAPRPALPDAHLVRGRGCPPGRDHGGRGRCAQADPRRRARRGHPGCGVRSVSADPKTTARMLDRMRRTRIERIRCPSCPIKSAPFSSSSARG